MKQVMAVYRNGAITVGTFLTYKCAMLELIDRFSVIFDNHDLPMPKNSERLSPRYFNEILEKNDIEKLLWKITSVS